MPFWLCWLVAISDRQHCLCRSKTILKVSHSHYTGIVFLIGIDLVHPNIISFIYLLEDLHVWGLNMKGLLERNQRKKFNTTEELANLSKRDAGTGALKPSALALVVSLTSTATAPPLSQSGNFCVLLPPLYYL